MSDADTLGLLVIFLCLIGSMFFSGSETAITSYGDRKARQTKEEGGRNGEVIASWVDRPVWVLSTILLGNNITNTLLGATATALAIAHLEGGKWGGYAVPVAVVLTTGVLLVFGEIVPKALGRHFSRRLMLPVLTALGGLSKICYPIVWCLTRLTEVVIARVTIEQDAGNRVTADELGYLVRVAEREGSIAADQAALLHGVFRFEDRIVRDIMVPVDRVTAIDIGWNLDEIRRVAKQTGHSRLPVYCSDIDHIEGILHIKQLVGLDADGADPETLRKVIRTPFFVSESLLAHDLLRQFKAQRVHLAVVVDDAGDTVGVVTLEDVLEQIVGQIFDESDRAPRAAAFDVAGLHYFDGQDSLARVEEALAVEVDEIDGVDSVGDLLTRLAGQVPIAGSIFVWENIRFRVLSADIRHILRVSAQRVELEDEDD